MPLNVRYSSSSSEWKRIGDWNIEAGASEVSRFYRPEDFIDINDDDDDDDVVVSSSSRRPDLRPTGNWMINFAPQSVLLTNMNLNSNQNPAEGFDTGQGASASASASAGPGASSRASRTGSGIMYALELHIVVTDPKGYVFFLFLFLSLFLFFFLIYNFGSVSLTNGSWIPIMHRNRRYGKFGHHIPCTDHGYNGMFCEQLVIELDDFNVDRVVDDYDAGAGAGFVSADADADADANGDGDVNMDSGLGSGPDSG